MIQALMPVLKLFGLTSKYCLAHHLPDIDVLELTQQHHESDRASEGLRLFVAWVFSQDLLAVMRSNWLCGCTISSAGTAEGVITHGQ